MLFLTYALVSGATTRKVFFVGNSFTRYNGMPDMLRDIAAAKGDTLVYDMSTPSGYKFQQHAVLAATLTGITSKPWDIVVLQEHGQVAAYLPVPLATQCYPFARKLDSIVDENDSCIETMFLMTWGWCGGDPTNCPSDPVVCTYEGMQERLRHNYMEMAQNNHASVAPLGVAWKIVVDSFPSINLYMADSSHPSSAGSYLEACVFYSSFFHRPSSGCGYFGGLSVETATTLQRIADKVVLDSLEQWQQYGHYPYSRYRAMHPAMLGVSFSNGCQRADTYVWAFGDGATSTEYAPFHTYANAGVYIVTLTASNECRSEVFSDTVHVGIVEDVAWGVQQEAGVRIINSGGGIVRFFCDADMHNGTLQVYDASGRKHFSAFPENGDVEARLAPGIYVLHVVLSDGPALVKRFSVY